jgi:hypothetical protein
MTQLAAHMDARSLRLNSQPDADHVFARHGTADLPAPRSLTLDDWDLTMQDIDGTGGVRVPARPSWQRLTRWLAMLTQLPGLGPGCGRGLARSAGLLSALGSLQVLTSLRGLTIGMVFPGGEAYRGCVRGVHAVEHAYVLY